MIEIRSATADHVEAWLELRCALWPEAGEAEHREEIKAFLRGDAAEPQEVFLAWDEVSRLVGLVELSIRPCAEGCRTNRVAYLEGWYVVPERRGLGIGRALVEAAQAWGRHQGCSELASDTQPDNQSSAAAHHALGFEDVGLLRCFRKEI